MGIDVKSNLENILKIPKNIKKNFSRVIKDNIEGEILSEISQGKSPVRSHTFEEYSDSYSKVKRGKRPVDMHLKGKMLKSLFVKQNTTSGDLRIGIDDEKSEWHQSGAGTLPVRKLLPIKSTDSFNVKLTKFINKALKNAVKKTLKRQ